MKKFLAGIIPVMIIFLSSTTSSAQLTGVKNIPGDYADLAAAITDLNTQGVGPGGVTLNLVAGNPQTAPSGGYAVTATGTLADPIVIEGNGNTITASASLAAGTLNDAIFKLIGADYVTISGFTMQENPANAITASASNNMTEWGVALLYASTTDGAQNNTIQNNTIDLDRTYPNSFGIYSNSTHSATAISVSATATTISGGNSGLKIFSNTITDVNNGIVVIGPVAAADHNDGLEIGGSVSTANSITNYGTTGSFSSYMNVSATVNGILIRNTKNITVTHNSISSSNGGHINGTIYGIQLPLFSQSSTGTITNNISHNSISVKSGLSSAGINGITLPSNSGTVSSTLNIDNNDFHDFGHTVAATGTIQFIQNTSGNQNISISGNTFTNMTVNTSGNVTFINNANASALVKYVNNNAIVTGFSKTTSGNTVRFILDTGTDFTNAVSNCNNNQISNITVTGITSVRGIDHWNSGSGLIKTISGNTISHISMSSTGTFSGINTDNNNGTSHVSTNTVYNISSGGLLTGISCGVSGSSSANTANFYQNLVHTLLSTGSGAVTGISINGQTASTRNCYRNKIYNLETAGISGTVNGISVGSGTNIHVYNNLVGDLRAPNAASANSSSDAIRGINITSSTANSTINVSYNTVYLNAVSAQPTLFNTCGISHAANASATSATLNMRNNIIVNLSSPNINGLGLTIAFRRTGNNPANYGSVSNNNLFYAGTPDQNRVVFYDGFNTYQTLSQFRFSVYPRETNSVSELPPFLSTTGSDADFLHLNAAVPTQAESGAAPVTGITDDYDTDARNGTSPDIGADEINGISADNTGPVIHFTALTNTLCTSGATLSATISDPSGVNNSAGTLPRIYFKKSSNANTLPATNDNTTDGWKYMEATNTSSPYNLPIDLSLVFGGAAPGDAIEYFVVAQDLATTPNVSNYGGLLAATPSSVALTAGAFPVGSPVNTYSIAGGGLSGTVTIGAAGDYPTLTGAGGLFAALNLGGLSGNLTASIIDPVVTETGANSLNRLLYGCGGPFTLTIQPGPGLAAELSGFATPAVIRLNGASFVTIDGLNSGGSSLLIRNLSTASPTIWLFNDASNNTIKNTTIEGANNSISSGVIALFGGISTGNDNNSILNNTIRDRSDATGIPANLIYSRGTSLTVSNSFNIINGNILKNFSSAGININELTTLNGEGNDHWTISNNEIYEEGTRTSVLTGITFASTGTNSITKNTIRDLTTSGIVYGIRLRDARNTLVSQNRIYNFNSTNGSTSTLSGIQFDGSNINPAYVTIVNNMVSIAPLFNNNQSIRGIYDFGFGGNTFKAFHNSIYIGGTSSGTNASWALVRGIGAPTNYTAINNIALNARTGSGNHFGGGDQSANTGTFVSDHNIFVGTGTVVADFMDYGTSGTGTPRSFAFWQTVPQPRDQNSLASNPGGNYSLSNMFVSATDLHANEFTINPASNAGIYAAGVETDFDGETRSIATPDIGADEYTQCNSVTIADAGSNQVQCNNGDFTLAGNTPVIGTGAWSVESGTATITDPSSPVSTVTGVPAGTTAVLRWTISIGICSNYDEVILANTLTTVTVSPASQQYSDKVSFTATITPASVPGHTAPTTVAFYVGTQNMGSATLSIDPLDNTKLVASLPDIALLEPSPFGTAPTGQMAPTAPGTRTVTADFTGESSGFAVCNPTTELTISQEDALVQYTGHEFASTGSASATSATVRLSATVTDMADGSRGDIRNARVRFRIVPYNCTSMAAEATVYTPWLNVSLVSPADNTIGTGFVDWTLNIGSCNAKLFEITTEVNHYYTATSQVVSLTVAKTLDDFVTGGGHLYFGTGAANRSTGTYRSSDDSKTHWGFNAKHNKKKTNLQGAVNIIIRSGGNTYQVKGIVGGSNGSLSVDASNPNNKKAILTAKANMTDVATGLPVPFGSNATMVMTMSDKAEPGANIDTYSITIWGSDNSLLYSSNWSGSATQEVPINGGNIQVRSNAASAPVNTLTKISPDAGMAPETEDFRVRVFPNPAQHEFTLVIESSISEKTEVVVYNAAGQIVNRIPKREGKYIVFGKELLPGTYLAEIIQGANRKTIKLIKQ